MFQMSRATFSMSIDDSRLLWVACKQRADLDNPSAIRYYYFYPLGIFIWGQYSPEFRHSTRLGQSRLCPQFLCNQGRSSWGSLGNTWTHTKVGCCPWGSFHSRCQLHLQEKMPKQFTLYFFFYKFTKVCRCANSSCTQDSGRTVKGIARVTTVG